MKHVFYAIYVLAFSGAVFMTGVFIGQFLERFWSVREEKALEREKNREIQRAPAGVPLRGFSEMKAVKGK
ncbi:MAG TPA: hypothetical protein VGB26_04005 [Nitrospiria bacterium]|jgi:hypothetical protein